MANAIVLIGNTIKNEFIFFELKSELIDQVKVDFGKQWIVILTNSSPTPSLSKRRGIYEMNNCSYF